MREGRSAMAIRKGSPQKPVKRKLMPVTPVTPRQYSNSVRFPQETAHTLQQTEANHKTAMQKKAPKSIPQPAATGKSGSLPVAVVMAEAIAQLPHSLASALPPSILEQPVRAQLTVRQRLGELRAAIAEGFLIQEPIYARPLWSSPDNSRIAYSFVLQLNQVTRLITVPDGRTVQQFIRERDLAVDYRR
jgi:hypothetical protein